MFLITNISSSEISISDLGITIYPKQVIDLHKIELKIPVERSKDLNLAIDKKCIKIIDCDKPIIQPVISEIKNNNKELFDGLKEIISSEIQKQLTNAKTDNSGLNDIISQLTDVLKNNKTNENKSTESFYSDIDENQLSEIHKKVSIKMSKNTENTVEYQEEKVVDKSINDTSELEDLL